MKNITFWDWQSCRRYESSYISVKNAIQKLEKMDKPTWNDYFEVFQVETPSEFDGNRPIKKRGKVRIQTYPYKVKKEIIVFIS